MPHSIVIAILITACCYKVMIVGLSDSLFLLFFIPPDMVAEKIGTKEKRIEKSYSLSIKS